MYYWGFVPEENSMYQDLKKNSSYPKTLTVLAVLAAVLSFGCLLLGYIFLPFAAAAYAALLSYENKSRRIVSYILPVVVFTVNIFLNGFFSAEGVAYLAVGILIYYLYSKNVSKNELSVWLTVLISLFLILSMILVGFSENNSVNLSAFVDFYRGLYSSLKQVFIEVVSGMYVPDDKGVLYFVFTREDAEIMFHSFLSLLPSFVIIFAFLLAGASLKFYSIFEKRFDYDSYNDKKRFFLPTKFLSYAYIVFAVLNLFVTGGAGIISSVIGNVYYVLLAVFLYVGLKFSYNLIVKARTPFFAICVFVVAFMFFGMTAISLLSFIGVYFSIFANREPKENEPKNL